MVVGSVVNRRTIRCCGSMVCHPSKGHAMKILIFTVMLGGGYTNAASDQHFALLLDRVNLARDQGKDLRVLILAYDLAPHEVYPVQLQQAVGALKYLLDSGVTPSQVSILRRSWLLS